MLRGHASYQKQRFSKDVMDVGKQKCSDDKGASRKQKSQCLAAAREQNCLEGMTTIKKKKSSPNKVKPVMVTSWKKITKKTNSPEKAYQKNHREIVIYEGKNKTKRKK